MTAQRSRRRECLCAATAATLLLWLAPCLVLVVVVAALAARKRPRFRHDLVSRSAALSAEAPVRGNRGEAGAIESIASSLAPPCTLSCEPAAMALPAVLLRLLTSSRVVLTASYGVDMMKEVSVNGGKTDPVWAFLKVSGTFC